MPIRNFLPGAYLVGILVAALPGCNDTDGESPPDVWDCHLNGDVCACLYGSIDEAGDNSADAGAVCGTFSCCVRYFADDTARCLCEDLGPEDCEARRRQFGLPQQPATIVTTCPPEIP